MAFVDGSCESAGAVCDLLSPRRDQTAGTLQVQRPDHNGAGFPDADNPARGLVVVAQHDDAVDSLGVAPLAVHEVARTLVDTDRLVRV